MGVEAQPEAGSVSCGGKKSSRGCENRGLLADIGKQCHEPGAFDGHLHGALKRSTIAAALAAKELALAGAHLLEALNVFVIDKGRPRTALLGAEPAAILPSSSKLLADHVIFALKYAEILGRCRKLLG
jgi:hypothetical protein